MDKQFIIIQRKNILTIRRCKVIKSISKKKIIHNFRKNDILNGGEGAPLTPIFHQLIALTKKN